MKKDSPFTFVTEGVEQAIKKANEAANGKAVGISTAKVLQQYLSAGLVDEIHIDQVDVLLGKGIPLFENLANIPVNLHGGNSPNVSCSKVVNKEKLKTLLIMKSIINLNKIKLTLLFVMTLLTQTEAQQTGENNSTVKSSGYAPVNGQKIYYEIHGEGEPIILLHGSYMTIEMNWGQIIPELSKTRKVIALEMQGHGRTTLTDRPYSYISLADDVAKTIKFLHLDSVDVLGYSFGGTIAFQVAMQHPQVVKKLIILSAPFKYVGWQPEVRTALQSMQPEFLSNTPLKTEYARVAPDSTKWSSFVERMIKHHKVDYNLGDEKLRNIKAPTLLIAGDNDGIDKSILMETYKQLGGCTFADMVGTPKSQLAILPGQGHVSLLEQSGVILQMIDSFLK